MFKVLVCLLSFLAGSVFGQTISGITGTVAQDSSVTISGSSFGTKATAAPLMWDDLSAYSAAGLSDYDYCPTGGSYPWTSDSVYTENPYYFTDSDSVRVTGRPVYGATRAGNLFGGENYAFDSTDILVLSYWAWFNQAPLNEAVVDVTKLTRFWSWAGYPYYGINLTFRSTLNGTYRRYDSGLVDTGEWHHLEMVIHNDPGVTSDLETTSGTYDTFINGQKAYATQPMTGDPSNGGAVDYIHRFGFDVRYDTDWPAGTIIRFGDVYIDKGLSRVIISNVNNFTWDNAAETYWEVQPATAWSATSITVDVNTGILAGSSSAWIYVVDSAGSVSGGYEVTIGTAGGGGDVSAVTSFTSVKDGN